MKLTKEQLVDLLCTATYSSEWLACKCLNSEKHLDGQFSQEYLDNRSLEDKWADRLLAGGTLVCIDYEDFEMDVEHNEEVPKRYKLTLKDFEEKLQKAPFEDDVCIVRSFCNWRTDDYDYYDCNNLLQYIMFGNVVYG